MAIVIENDEIKNIKNSNSIVEEYSIPNDGGVHGGVAYHDLQGKAVVPGLVDAHTHLLWSGDRSPEVRQRREGLSYAEIAASGGGIQSTVSATRAASDEHLFRDGYVRLREALRTGTTYLEAKSGYGLTVKDELRLLEIAHRLDQMTELPSLHPTWMGAHDVPKGQTKEAYMHELLSKQLPAVAEQGIARSADVFCEPGWFDLDETHDLLRDSKNAGLGLRMHVDEFANGGGGELAASLRVETADHAYHTPMNARKAMAANDVMTGFLPGTPYAMGDGWPDMNSMVEEGIPYSLATDFNPNCQTLSLPFMMSLMVQRCGVHPLEALRATTVNAAKSTPHVSGRPHGCIVEGGVANLNIVDGPNWEAVTLRPTGTPFCATILEGRFISH
ncbi:MAG: imidazolonepropionase [Candidatus Poseidonia sp.]|nr:imidazolonepropionase [Poseidonia sp.]